MANKLKSNNAPAFAQSNVSREELLDAIIKGDMKKLETVTGARIHIQNFEQHMIFTSVERSQEEWDRVVFSPEYLARMESILNRPSVEKVPRLEPPELEIPEPD